MKECFKCGETKDISEFYAHPQMADGHLGKCKECTKKDVHINREDKLEFYREYDRVRGNRLSREDRKSYRERNRHKRNAHKKVCNAIASGKLSRPDECPRCGRTLSIIAHHADYDKPLDVEWMCQACHCAEHKHITC